MSKTRVAPKAPARKTARHDRPSVQQVKLMLRHCSDSLVLDERFTGPLQELIDLVDYRARRPLSCPVGVWIALKFRSRDLQDSVRELTSTLEAACAYLEVDTKPEPKFVDWLRHQLTTLAILRGYSKPLTQAPEKAS